MRAMTRRALARSATISAGAAIAVPPKTPLARSCMATLQHTRLGAVAYGRICPVHVWPVLRCPPRLVPIRRRPDDCISRARAQSAHDHVVNGGRVLEYNKV